MDFVRRDCDGNVLLDTQAAPAGPRPSDGVLAEPLLKGLLCRRSEGERDERAAAASPSAVRCLTGRFGSPRAAAVGKPTAAVHDDRVRAPGPGLCSVLGRCRFGSVLGRCCVGSVLGRCWFGAVSMAEDGAAAPTDASSAAGEDPSSTLLSKGFVVLLAVARGSKASMWPRQIHQHAREALTA